MNKRNHKPEATFETPIGWIGLSTHENFLTHVHLLGSGKYTENCPTTFTKKIRQKFLRYFENPHYTVECPILLTGTSFQLKIWRMLARIPCSTLVTYGDLAKKSQSSARAIGQACRTNPCPIVIPCHRVVAKHHLGGFNGHSSGKFWKMKEQLLALEH